MVQTQEDNVNRFTKIGGLSPKLKKQNQQSL